MMNNKWIENGLENLRREFGDEKVKNAIEAVKQFEVEIPSWTLGPFGGGRFGNYTPPGYAKNIEQKIEDAAFIYSLTGANRHLSTHILWDFSDDGMEGNYKIAQRVKTLCEEKGLKLGAINPTYFLTGSEQGSFISPSKETKKRYMEQTILGGKIAKELGNGILSLWFPDGSLYRDRLTFAAYTEIKETLQRSMEIPSDVNILVEYKVFERGHTTLPIGDILSSYQVTGSNAGVLIDLGHHYHSTNIEQIVSMLAAENVRCGFI